MALETAWRARLASGQFITTSPDGCYGDVWPLPGRRGGRGVEAAVEDEIVELRKHLAEEGNDAGDAGSAIPTDTVADMFDAGARTIPVAQGPGSGQCAVHLHDLAGPRSPGSSIPNRKAPAQLLRPLRFGLAQ